MLRMNELRIGSFLRPMMMTYGRQFLKRLRYQRSGYRSASLIHKPGLDVKLSGD